MHYIIIIIPILSLLVGCSTQPKSYPKPTATSSSATADKSDQAAIFAMMLLAGAAQNHNSSAYKFLEVKITPLAFQVLGRIVEFRNSNGKWPEKSEIIVPEGVTDIILTQKNSDLEIGVRNGETLLLHCNMNADGTIVFEPLAVRLIDGMKSAAQNTRSSGIPFPGFIPFPIK